MPCGAKIHIRPLPLAPTCAEEERGPKREALARAGDEDGQTAEKTCFEGTWHTVIYVVCQPLFTQNKQNDVLLSKKTCVAKGYCEC